MSDEFMKVATKEIIEELSDIAKILASCKNDENLLKNSDKIEKHLHNIKGLAPMMGKEQIGNLAKSLDSILKKIISGHQVDGFFEPLSISIEQMIIAMDKSNDLGEVQEQISNIASKIVD